MKSLLEVALVVVLAIILLLAVNVGENREIGDPSFSNVDGGGLISLVLAGAVVLVIVYFISKIHLPLHIMVLAIILGVLLIVGIVMLFMPENGGSGPDPRLYYYNLN